MVKLLFAFMLFICPTILYTNTWLEPKTMTLGLEYIDNFKNPYWIEDENHWTYGAELGTKIDIWRKEKLGWGLFFNPTLRFRSTESQIRYGALYFETGLSYKTEDRCYRFFRRHLSEHVFERERDGGDYPAFDSYQAEVEWEFR